MTVSGAVASAAETTEFGAPLSLAFCRTAPAASGHTSDSGDAALFTLGERGFAGPTDGAPPSGMPADGGVLTDAEIVAILSRIERTSPRDVRHRHDAVDERVAGR